MLLDIFYTVFGVPYILGSMASANTEHTYTPSKRQLEREELEYKYKSALLPTEDVVYKLDSYRTDKIRLTDFSYINDTICPYLIDWDKRCAELKKTYDELKDDLIYIYGEEEFSRRFDTNSPDFRVFPKTRDEYTKMLEEESWLRQLLFARNGYCILVDSDHDYRRFHWGDHFDVIQPAYTGAPPTSETIKIRLKFLERIETYLQKSHRDLDLTFYLENFITTTTNPDPAIFCNDKDTAQMKHIRVSIGEFAGSFAQLSPLFTVDCAVKYIYQPDGKDFLVSYYKEIEEKERKNSFWYRIRHRKDNAEK